MVSYKAENKMEFRPLKLRADRIGGERVCGYEGQVFACVIVGFFEDYGRTYCICRPKGM